MKSFRYIVKQIDGDYAYLMDEENETAELKIVARALLPEEINEGSHLLYEFLQYKLV